MTTICFGLLADAGGLLSITSAIRGAGVAEFGDRGESGPHLRYKAFRSSLTVFGIKS